MTGNQLAGIGCHFCVAAIIRQVCGGGRHPDPLAIDFSVLNFDLLMGGDSDGIVPVTSALKGFSRSSTFTQVVPDVHSSGAVQLDFGPPTLLDGVSSSPPSDLAMRIINLLNMPVVGSAFVSLP